MILRSAIKRKQIWIGKDVLQSWNLLDKWSLDNGKIISVSTECNCSFMKRCAEFIKSLCECWKDSSRWAERASGFKGAPGHTPAELNTPYVRFCLCEKETWHFWGCDVVTSSQRTEPPLWAWPCRLTSRHPWHRGRGPRSCVFGRRRKTDCACVQHVCWQTTGVCWWCQGVKRSSRRPHDSHHVFQGERFARVTNTYPWGMVGQ